MPPDAFLLLLMASTFALAAPGTVFVRAVAIRRGLMDHPSQLSSHTAGGRPALWDGDAALRVVLALRGRANID